MQKILAIPEGWLRNMPPILKECLFLLAVLNVIFLMYTSEIIELIGITFSSDTTEHIRFVLYVYLLLYVVGSRIDNRRVGKEAGKDFLTGLLNRRSLHDAISGLTHENHQSDRSALTQFCLAMVDVDHFKILNDTLGHRAGDEALRIVAQLLRESFRSTDILGRYGGDEFMVIFPRTSMAVAREKLEQLRKILEDDERLCFKDKHLQELCLTISVGIISVTNGDTQTPIDELFNRADGFLYLAKQGGRNCIRTDADEKGGTPIS